VKPKRIQLRRSRGWRMPKNTVKVDRSTKWGNPFIVGKQGNAAYCLHLYGMLLRGYHCLSAGMACSRRQETAAKALLSQAPRYAALRGKNLACWCKVGEPCHGDLLLLVANRKRRVNLDINKFLEQYGWRVRDGKAERLGATSGAEHGK
jgi:hypothetical protein